MDTKTIKQLAFWVIVPALIFIILSSFPEWWKNIKDASAYEPELHHVEIEPDDEKEAELLLAPKEEKSFNGFVLADLKSAGNKVAEVTSLASSYQPNVCFEIYCAGWDFHDFYTNKRILPGDHLGELWEIELQEREATPIIPLMNEERTWALQCAWPDPYAFNPQNTEVTNFPGDEGIPIVSGHRRHKGQKWRRFVSLKDNALLYIAVVDGKTWEDSRSDRAKNNGKVYVRLGVKDKSLANLANLCTSVRKVVVRPCTPH